MYYLYILRCTDRSYFIGVCKNLNERLSAHQNGQFSSLPTYDKRPVELVYELAFDDIREALFNKANLYDWDQDQITALVEEKRELSPFNMETERVVNRRAILLPTAYLSPIRWFQEIKTHDSINIICGEQFQKQTYRSRATILGANGPLNLIVPVSRPFGKNTSTKDVLISYQENWQKDHSKAIISAYGRAPYYSYFGEELLAIINSKYQTLAELNLELIKFLVEAFDIDCEVKNENSNLKVSRLLHELMQPKLRCNFEVTPYNQVLSEGEFEPNLSALDALFNIGKLPTP